MFVELKMDYITYNNRRCYLFIRVRIIILFFCRIIKKKIKDVKR